VISGPRNNGVLFGNEANGMTFVMGDSAAFGQ